MTIVKTLAALIAATSLAACVAPTSYQAAEGNRFGYGSRALTQHLYRVGFHGSNRTPQAWIDAFLLYRSAEIAQAADAPAFKIIEGKVNLDVLTSEEVFGAVDLDREVLVTPQAKRNAVEEEQGGGDVVVGENGAPRRADPSLVHRTAGFRGGGVYRMPAPLPRLPRTQPAPLPTYIYTPTYIYSYRTPVINQRSVLVELLPDLKNMDADTLVTVDVLGRLGPRIKGEASGKAAPEPVAPAANSSL